jgi:hypothetical protein
MPEIARGGMMPVAFKAHCLLSEAGVRFIRYVCILGVLLMAILLGLWFIEM